MAAARRWNLTPKQAIQLQRELREQLALENRLPVIARIGGADVGFEDGGRVTRAAVVVCDASDMTVLDRQIVRQPTRFPYMPGLLSFREVPAILEALDGLRRPPDLLLCDGHGYAHPRRLGVACHIGLATGLPTIGVGKSRLVGEHKPVPAERGSWSALRDCDETIGAVLRTRNRVAPVYVSPGHRIDLPTAVQQVMACLKRYRLPEPIRAADRLASAGHF